MSINDIASVWFRRMCAALSLLRRLRGHPHKYLTTIKQGFNLETHLSVYDASHMLDPTCLAHPRSKLICTDYFVAGILFVWRFVLRLPPPRLMLQQMLRVFADPPLLTTLGPHSLSFALHRHLAVVVGVREARTRAVRDGQDDVALVGLEGEEWVCR